MERTRLFHTFVLNLRDKAVKFLRERGRKDTAKSCSLITRHTRALVLGEIAAVVQSSPGYLDLVSLESRCKIS